MALYSLYNPLATVSAYFPIVGSLSRIDQFKLAIGLFLEVSAFSLAALWLGEPFLELLGLSTASLIVTGGIALFFSALPMMLGKSELPAKFDRTADISWRSVLFMPITFPLTLNGTTFAFFVSYRAEATGVRELLELSAIGVAYAALTAATLYASGYLERRATFRVRNLLERVTGILLTATAVSLVASGIAQMVLGKGAIRAD